ncbi:hypothetical protein Cpir12675_006109 [Ceratocystis pirilliformis]|uniref:C2H2-type domain-containing protein n=1 Tax=Ceratocystis pirilliformis TaxID=259994 RepID=A0ABR3YJW4_9PEZI
MSNRQSGYAPWSQMTPSNDASHSHMMNHHIPQGHGSHHPQQQQQPPSGPPHTTSDSSITPPPTTSRSVTSSPPKAGMTPEQREMKRQQNQVRRDSKTTSRIRRANSNPYGNDIPGGPPSAGLGSVYSGSPAGAPATGSMPMMGENPGAPMQSPSYLHPYSPPLAEGQSHYQYQSPHMQSTYGMPMDYSGFQQHPQSSYARGRHPPPSNIPMDPNASMMYGAVPSMMSPSMPQPSPHGHSHTHSGHVHPHGAHPHAVAPPPHMGAAEANNNNHVRVVQTRPKPQCWEHGCNGRQFSTFSNLLRHQREKSGQAAKATCPNCGAEFTRTTARNGHLLHDKCKKRSPNPPVPNGSTASGTNQPAGQPAQTQVQAQGQQPQSRQQPPSQGQQQQPQQ